MRFLRLYFCAPSRVQMTNVAGAGANTSVMDYVDRVHNQSCALQSCPADAGSEAGKKCACAWPARTSFSLTFWAACRSANGSCTRPCSTSASTATPISSVRCLALHTSTRLHSPTAGICTFAAAAAGTPAGTPRSFLLLLLLLLLLLHLLLLHLHVDVAGVNVDLPAALGGGHFQLGANNVVHPHLAGAPAPAPTG
jgi:hypothetical protein